MFVHKHPIHLTFNTYSLLGETKLKSSAGFGLKS